MCKCRCAYVFPERFTIASARFHEADTPYLERLKYTEPRNRVGERVPGCNLQV